MTGRDTDQRNRRDRYGDEKEKKDPSWSQEPAEGPSAQRVDELRERSEGSLRERLESIVPDALKRAMVTGLGALFVTEETIRSAVGDMRLPKEAVNFVVQQADNTRDQLFRHIAREFREYLEKADMAEELPRILSKMVIEVNSEIRFRPTSDPLGYNGTFEHDIHSDVTVKKAPGKDEEST